MSDVASTFSRLVARCLLAVCCFSFLITKSGSALSNGLLGGCSNVRIEGLSPLDFGNLLFSKNSRGIVTIDSKGRVDVPIGVSTSPASGSSPAVIEISGPPGSEVYISLRLNDRKAGFSSARLADLKLTKMGRALPKVGDYWVIEMPSSTRDTSTTTINMVGALVINGMAGRSILSYTVDFHCEFVSQLKS